MKFQAVITTLLAAGAGLTSAAPAWGEPVSEEAVASSPAAPISKRAWPWGKGDCYGSGQWGKQEDGRHAIRDFCKQQ